MIGMSMWPPLPVLYPPGLRAPPRNYADNVWEGYNPVKERFERWQRCDTGDQPWILMFVCPGRVFHESFIAAPNLVPAILQLSGMETWVTTGNPNPDGTTFESLSEYGGGLKTNTKGTTGKWVSIHKGDSYFTDISKSPHLKFIAALDTITNLRSLLGMIGSSGKPAGGGAWSEPDYGIWYEWDTSKSPSARFVTKNGAGNKTETAFSGVAPVTGRHYSFYIYLSDAGDKVYFIDQGVLVATHETDLPAVMLQPYFVIETLENAVKIAHLHDYRLIMDKGF